MKRILVVLLLLAVAVTSTGCAARSFSQVASAPAPPMADRASGERESPAETYADALGSAGSGAGLAGDTERMIIKTADITMVVADTEIAMTAVTDLVSSMGGYVSHSEAWRQSEQLRAQITLRIPADKLDGALAAIKALAVRVDRENVGGQDVTEEFSDLDAQLVNLEATEEELRELLAEVRQRTQKAEDILQVYRELTQIRGEIERVKGRMGYLSNLTAMATINLELVPDILAKPVVAPGWRPAETVRNAGRSLVNALKGLVNALIWLVIYVLPLLLLFAIPIVLLVLVIRWLVRRRKRG